MKVLVQSFSFLKTGYPEDKTGHGGGFVFDCRTNANPGIIESCMRLTGLDKPVSNLLDKDEGVECFFSGVWILVSQSIIKCIDRNFKIMTVNFGCTGGQHRSVYFAERLAQRVRSVFPEVEVELIHLERSHWPKKN